jgi:hypothetical protein
MAAFLTFYRNSTMTRSISETSEIVSFLPSFVDAVSAFVVTLDQHPFGSLVLIFILILVVVVSIRRWNPIS